MLDQDRESLEAGEFERLRARAEIVESWRRCRMLGVQPDRLDLRHKPPTTDSRLRQSAVPLLASMVESLVGTHTSVLLTDRCGQLIWRWSEDNELSRTLDRRSVVEGTYWDETAVGTGGVGTALETMRPQVVSGVEHFVEALHPLTCLGVPIRHPITNRVEGVLNLSCLVEDTHPLMRPTLLRMTGEIESKLFGESSARDRQLFHRFLGERRRSRTAVVAVNDEIVIANKAASGLNVDHTMWWPRIEDELGGGEWLMTDETGRTLEVREVVEHGSTIGAVIVINESDESDHGSGAASSAVAHPAEITADRRPALHVPHWDEVLATAHRLAAAGGTMLVTGEPGVGKLTLLQALTTEFSVCDAAAIGAVGAGSWLGRLRGSLPASAGAVLAITHLDALDDAMARSVSAVLDETGGGRAGTVAGTWTTPIEHLSSARQALFERLCGIGALEIPPLRHRPDDLAALLRTALANDPTVRLSIAAAHALHGSPWPGNARQVAAFGEWLRGQDKAIIDIGDLPARVHQDRLRKNLTPMEAAEVDVILRTLRQCDWNKVAAAATLGISRSSLYRKIREYRIEA
jgi:sigma-54 dependent transcriptional regulator, acetoin dehydrogenase operon transcriptional activator AcoR